MDRVVRFQVGPGEGPLRAACQQVWQISAELRAARGRSGWAASDVAAEAYVRRQTVTAIEMGTTWPDARTLAQLCFVLGLSMAAQSTQEDS